MKGKESKRAKESKDTKETKETIGKESKDTKGAKEPTGSTEPKVTKGAKEPRAPKEPVKARGSAKRGPGPAKSGAPGVTPSSQVLDILMVTPEARPFAKTGGLADVSNSLSRALARL